MKDVVEAILKHVDVEAVLTDAIASEHMQGELRHLAQCFKVRGKEVPHDVRVLLAQPADEALKKKAFVKGGRRGSPAGGLRKGGQRGAHAESFHLVGGHGLGCYSQVTLAGIGLPRAAMAE